MSGVKGGSAGMKKGKGRLLPTLSKQQPPPLVKKVGVATPLVKVEESASVER